MRRAMVGLLGALSASAAMMAGAAPAAAFDYPYCLQGQEWGIPGECSYPSYEACQAAASGRGLSCNINPRVAFRQPPPDARRYSRRHPDYNYSSLEKQMP